MVKSLENSEEFKSILNNLNEVKYDKNLTNFDNITDPIQEEKEEYIAKLRETDLANVSVVEHDKNIWEIANEAGMKDLTNEGNNLFLAVPEDNGINKKNDIYYNAKEILEKYPDKKVRG